RVSRGEVDAALELHKEELTVYEALGDQRSRAVTLGDIASIRVSRGEVDDGLALLGQALEIHRMLSNQDGIAATQNIRADALLAKQDWQGAAEALAESFGILQRIGRMDGLGVVGLKFAQLLLRGGANAEGHQVLTVARRAWEVLGQADAMAACDQLAQQFPLAE
ncbi:MAG: hypothetical protein AAFX85_12120, partial [Pseudomonadota bacterium]